MLSGDGGRPPETAKRKTRMAQKITSPAPRTQGSKAKLDPIDGARNLLPVSTAKTPARQKQWSELVPELVAHLGHDASKRFFAFFTDNIRNPNSRRRIGHVLHS